LTFNKAISTSIVISFFSLVIYFLVITDFHISEITFGNTKISMLKEKYNDEINNQFGNINQLLRKINAEGRLIEGMKEYCKKRTSEYFNACLEYQRLLTEYFKEQAEEVNVYVLDNLDPLYLKQNFGIKAKDIEILKYRLSHDEIYLLTTDETYRLFIPFYYVFEEIINDEKPVYIVLESRKPIVCEAESVIVKNLLIKFCDDFVQLYL